MNGRLNNIICIVFMLGGCASQYGAKGLDGGYSDKQIDQTTYFVRYDAPSLAGGHVSVDGLSALWSRRAKELCGGDDFFKDIVVEGFGKLYSMRAPAVYGVAYCNNKFIDTRKENADEKYLPYISLPYEVFEYKETSPLWGLLINGRYAELQSAIDDLVHNNEDESSGLLGTFSRIDVLSERHLTEWVNSNPGSFVALYSRALYYYGYAWFKRGHGLWAEVSKEQQDEFHKYAERALGDLEKSLAVNPKFCPSHALKIQIYTSKKSAEDAAFDEVYRTAEKECPSSMAVRRSYLRHLLPRWGGSKEKMSNYIAEQKNRDKSYDVLDALYFAEEGDQYLFKRKYNQALEKYNAALAIGSFAQIFINRASVLEREGRYVGAVNDLGRAITLNPYNYHAYERMARVLFEKHDYVEALIASSYLIAMNNQSPKSFEIQGDILYLMRRYDDALASYKRAAILSSDKVIHLHKIRMTEYQLDIRKDLKDLKEVNSDALAI